MPLDSRQISGLRVHHNAQAKAGAQRTEKFADIKATFSTLSREVVSGKRQDNSTLRTTVWPQLFFDA